MALAAGLGFAKYLVVARILAPEAFGYYGLVLIVLPFGVYLSNWGLLHSLNVRIPAMLGRGETRTANAVLSRSYSFVIGSSSLTAVLYLAVLYAVPFTDDNARFVLLLSTATVILTNYTEFFIFVLRVHRNLLTLGSLVALRSVLSLTLGTVGAIVASYRGLIICELLALGIAAVAGIYVSGAPKPSWPRGREVKALLLAGAPLLVADLVVAVRFTFDRILVATSIPESLGQYTFAALVTLAFSTSLAIAMQALFPQLLFEHGAGLALPRMRRRVRAHALRMMTVAAAVGVPVLLLAGYSDPGFLQQYELGLRIAWILLLGGVLSIFTLYSVILLAVDRFRLTMMIAALASGLGLIGGLALALTVPSATRFAWLFAATQGLAGLGYMIAGERVARRAR